jgi:hypothetical protein
VVGPVTTLVLSAAEAFTSLCSSPSSSMGGSRPHQSTGGVVNGALVGFSTTRRSRAPSWPGGAQPRGSKSPIACIRSAITGQNPDEGGSTQDALILVLALPMLIVRGVPAQSSTPSTMRMSRSAALPRTASAALGNRGRRGWRLLGRGCRTRPVRCADRYRLHTLIGPPASGLVRQVSPLAQDASSHRMRTGKSQRGGSAVECGL